MEQSTGFTFSIVASTIILSIAYSNYQPTISNQMDSQSKITLAQAARLVGVHRNTVKNWQREGKLTSAEKVLERGIEVWYVSPAEVQEVARQSRDNRLGNSLPLIDPSSGYPTTNQPPTTATAPTAGQNTLDLIRESIVKPLTDVIERQNNVIAEQANRIGRLEKEVEQLKQATSRQEAPQQAERAKDVSEQGQEPRKRKWWQR